jgi:integrase
MLFRVYSNFVPNLTRQDGSAMERLLASQMAQGALLEQKTPGEGPSVFVPAAALTRQAKPKRRGIHSKRGKTDPGADQTRAQPPPYARRAQSTGLQAQL